MWIVTGKWERKRNIKPKPSPKHKKLANISLKLTKVTPPKKKNNTQHFLIWMSNEGSFDHLGTFGMTILIDNKSYSSKSWHDQIDIECYSQLTIFPGSSGWNHGHLLLDTRHLLHPLQIGGRAGACCINTHFSFSSSPILCPGLRCCPPWCGSPGPWGQNRARVPQILPGEKTFLPLFTLFWCENALSLKYTFKRSSEKRCQISK